MVDQSPESIVFWWILLLYIRVFSSKIEKSSKTFQGVLYFSSGIHANENFVKHISQKCFSELILKVYKDNKKLEVFVAH